MSGPVRITRNTVPWYLNMRQMKKENFIMRDIGHMEDFATAVMVLNEILLPRMKL